MSRKMTFVFSAVMSNRSAKLIGSHSFNRISMSSGVVVLVFDTNGSRRRPGRSSAKLDHARCAMLCVRSVETYKTVGNERSLPFLLALSFSARQSVRYVEARCSAKIDFPVPVGPTMQTLVVGTPLCLFVVLTFPFSRAPSTAEGR